MKNLFVTVMISFQVLLGYASTECEELKRQSLTVDLTRGSAVVEFVVEQEERRDQAADVYDFTLQVLPQGYRSRDDDAVRVQLPSLTSLGGPVHNCYVGLAYPSGTLEILSVEQYVYDQSGGRWREIPEISGLERQLLDITIDIVKEVAYEQYPILKSLEVVFEWSNDLAESAYRSEAERFLQNTNFSVQPVLFQSLGTFPSARRLTFRAKLGNHPADSLPLAFLIDAEVDYVQPITFPMTEAAREGKGHLEKPILFAMDSKNSESSGTHPNLPEFEYPAGYPLHDSFEDGVIDRDLWITGGATRGWSEDQSTGIGDWSYSIKEVNAPDGYLQLRVYGPRSGFTYGAEAWARTAYDFNDGNDHVINFCWEADIHTRGHYDLFFIQVTNGYVPRNGSVHWPRNQPHQRTADLLCQEVRGDVRPGMELKSGRSKDIWSLVIDSDGNAQLYDEPDRNGRLVRSVRLNPTDSWYVRFMVIDATSSGFPAGDDRLNLYDITAAIKPE